MVGNYTSERTEERDGCRLVPSTGRCDALSARRLCNHRHVRFSLPSVIRLESSVPPWLTENRHAKQMDDGATQRTSRGNNARALTNRLCSFAYYILSLVASRGIEAGNEESVGPLIRNASSYYAAAVVRVGNVGIVGWFGKHCP